MSEELLDFLKEAQKNPKEDILNPILFLMDKMMEIVSIIDSNITLLTKRVDDLELRSHQTECDTPKEISPLPSPQQIPKPHENTTLALMTELKELFKKKTISEEIYNE